MGILYISHLQLLHFSLKILAIRCSEAAADTIRLVDDSGLYSISNAPKCGVWLQTKERIFFSLITLNQPSQKQAG